MGVSDPVSKGYLTKACRELCEESGGSLDPALETEAKKRLTQFDVAQAKAAKRGADVALVFRPILRLVLGHQDAQPQWKDPLVQICARLWEDHGFSAPTAAAKHLLLPRIAS